MNIMTLRVMKVHLVIFSIKFILIKNFPDGLLQTYCLAVGVYNKIAAPFVFGLPGAEITVFYRIQNIEIGSERVLVDRPVDPFPVRY